MAVNTLCLTKLLKACEPRGYCWVNRAVFIIAL
jgi:hypothetical protein